MGDALWDRLRQAVADRARVEELEREAQAANIRAGEYAGFVDDLRSQLAAATKRAEEAEQLVKSFHQAGCSCLGEHGPCDCGFHEAFQRGTWRKK